jgi:RNA polymerase sigma-70 factor (ECF subfamily)
MIVTNDGAEGGTSAARTTDPARDPQIDPLTDAALMRAVIDGSQDALAGLYDRHNRAVFGAALRTSRDQWIASEVVQETFLALWNRAELYDPARGTLTSWLLTIARNRAVDHLRSASRHDRAATFSSFGRDDASDYALAEWLAASGELVGAAGPEPAPESALSSKELRNTIDEAIAALGPTERSVILLAYDSGLTQAEIAVRLGWPLGTVKTRTRRALGRLREMLEGSADIASDHPAADKRARTQGGGPEGRGHRPARSAHKGPAPRAVAPMLDLRERPTWGSPRSSLPPLVVSPCR